MKALFISHNAKDKPFVRCLAAALSTYGIDSWIDESEIRVGESLINKISEAIENIELVIVVISSNSIQSSWVRQELDWAMTKEINKRKVVILPLVIDKCDIPFFLANKLYADFIDNNKFDIAVKKFVEAINYHRGKKPSNTDDIIKIGETVNIRYNPTNIPLILSSILIFLGVSLALSTYFYSRTNHKIPNFQQLEWHVYTFSLLMVGLLIAEIVRLLFTRYLIGIDPGFSNDAGMIRMTSLFFRRYRNLVCRYWSRTLVKLSVIFEVVILFCIVILIIYAIKISSFL